jgi:hypothetical protein
MFVRLYHIAWITTPYTRRGPGNVVAGSRDRLSYQSI